jgi:uncharacterized membrane protein YidH (DUF202 family)
MKNKIKKIALFFSLFSPVVVFGADMSTIGGILEWATTLLKDTILPLLISVGVVFFIYGVTRFYLAPSNEKEKEKYKGFMMKGLVALFVMVSFWGIIKIFTETFDLEGKQPVIPQVPDIK